MQCATRRLNCYYFFARLTAPTGGLLNHYYFFRPKELCAHCTPPTSCPPDVICQMPDVRRLRTAGVSALRASAYYGSGKMPEAENVRNLDILLEGSPQNNPAFGGFPFVLP